MGSTSNPSDGLYDHEAHDHTRYAPVGAVVAMCSMADHRDVLGEESWRRLNEAIVAMGSMKT